MKNGSALGFVKNNPKCDLIHLVCLHSFSMFVLNDKYYTQVIGIAEGLAYLHQNGVVHSDIKPVRGFLVSSIPLDLILPMAIG